MEFQTDLPGWLNHCVCPGFAVKNNIITHCNQAAQALLLAPGADVRDLLLTGSEDYAAFQTGCLHLKLNLCAKGWGASLFREGDYTVFLLDPEPEDTDLRSLALAARELRSPLSNLMIAADTLSQRASGNPDLQEQLARLHRSLHQMHRLVNNMSDAGRDIPLSPAGLHDWSRVIHDVFEKIAGQLDRTDVQLTYEGPEEAVIGLVNEDQMQRAILNIVSNAMKFMPEGGSIHAKLTRKKDMLQLSIRDSGSGIADNVLSTVFSRYRRQAGIEDGRYGIGLGMVLIRSAAADHGGTVLIDRPEGGGTRVTMTMAIRQDSSLLKSPVFQPVVDDSRQVLTELSESLPWEFYQK